MRRGCCFLPQCQADCAGILPDEMDDLKITCLPTDDVDMAALRQEIVDAGYWLPYEVNGKPYLLIRTFSEDQKVDRPSVRYSLPSDEWLEEHDLHLVDVTFTRNEGKKNRKYTVQLIYTAEAMTSRRPVVDQSPLREEKKKREESNKKKKEKEEETVSDQSPTDTTTTDEEVSENLYLEAKEALECQGYEPSGPQLLKLRDRLTDATFKKHWPRALQVMSDHVKTGKLQMNSPMNFFLSPRFDVVDWANKLTAEEQREKQYGTGRPVGELWEEVSCDN